MKVKVVFVKGNFNPGQSEVYFDSDDGWDLFDVVPLPAPAQSGSIERSGTRFGSLGDVARESHARVALVFVEEATDVVDLRREATGRGESRTGDAIRRLSGRTERSPQVLMPERRPRRVPPPPPPPASEHPAADAAV